MKRNSGAGFICHGQDDQKSIALEHMIWEKAIPACERAKIEWHGIHAFRRGLASQLHDLDIPELTISHILRHSTKSSKSVTGKHYIKPSLERMRAALERVEVAYKKIEKKGRR